MPIDVYIAGHVAVEADIPQQVAGLPTGQVVYHMYFSATLSRILSAYSREASVTIFYNFGMLRILRCILRSYLV